MLTKRASVGSPISGLRPEKLMWSESSISSPGGMSGRNEPAALVRISRSAPRARSSLERPAHQRRRRRSRSSARGRRARRRGRLRDRRRRGCGWWPRDAGVRKARQVGVVDRDAVDGVGQMAEAGAEHEAERRPARRRRGRGWCRPGPASALLDVGPAAGPGRDRLADEAREDDHGQDVGQRLHELHRHGADAGDGDALVADAEGVEEAEEQAGPRAPARAATWRRSAPRAR